MKTADGREMYKARKWGDSELHYFPDESLERLAADLACIDQKECAQILANRRAFKQRTFEAEQLRKEQKRARIEDDPFDPRTEVSADAVHIASRIVKHLWILFVLFPLMLGILAAIIAGMMHS